MQMVENARVVVYLVNGFLESGKTRFLTQTLEQDYFAIEGKTVLILCEEGEEEYDKELLRRTNTILLTVDGPEEVTKDWLAGVDLLYNPERVIFECNGMYPVSKMEEMDVPKGWGLVQEITIVDASTFDMYIANMKPLFVEMVRNAELVIFNRCTKEMPLAAYRRNVKVVNQNAEIVFEGADGEIDNIFDEHMPYDLEAPVVKIEDMDYGIWYVDMIDHPKRYAGKTVEFCGKVLRSRGAQPDECIVGRKTFSSFSHFAKAKLSIYSFSCIDRSMLFRLLHPQNADHSSIFKLVPVKRTSSKDTQSSIFTEPKTPSPLAHG